MERHGTVRRVVFDEGERLVDSHVGRVALGRRGQIDRRFGQRNAGLGHTDLVHRIEAGIGQQQGVGIGQSDVLRGENHQPAGDEAGLLAAGEHPCQVVDRSIGIAAPHRFEEGRDDIVVLFAVLVVEGDVLLQAVGDQPVGDRQPALVGRQQNVQNIEQLARIAAREAEQRLRFAHVDPPLAQFGVGGDRTVEQPLQLGVLHRSQDVDLAAAQQRRNHLERRVFGRGAHERHDTLLDGPQQRILLRLVETVDFVDEQDRRRRVEEVLLAGRFDHFAHILDPRRNGRQREEGAFEFRGHDLSQRGLPHPRRPPEDKGGDASRVDHLAQDSPRPHQVFLTYIIVQCLRTQTFC